MLRIAVCDDIHNELQNIVSLTNQYISANSITAQITEFPHPDALLTAVEAESYHIYILDIVMPMVNGLELGKEIRRFDSEAQIIYATTEPQFALQAYAANPINYLIKPIEKQHLFDTLTLAISKVDFTEEQIFTVKTADSLRVIKLSNIVCCEYSNHTVIFSLSNGEEVVSRTIRENFSEYCTATAVMELTLPESYIYGITDMKTDHDGKLYIYIPAGKTGDAIVSTATGTYYGSISNYETTFFSPPTPTPTNIHTNTPTNTPTPTTSSVSISPNAV